MSTISELRQRPTRVPAGLQPPKLISSSITTSTGRAAQQGHQPLASKLARRASIQSFRDIPTMSATIAVGVRPSELIPVKVRPQSYAPLGLRWLTGQGSIMQTSPLKK
ncbi:hypothetical protein [Cryobacterium sp. Y29]|uniref:hypothetical protein n=1 Tax=Cryobacterium sp. Y29 TaxID=2048285 RepID=UPI001E4FE4C7|nr:hypothetical protein [Cryobacterium sp. Y29]